MKRKSSLDTELSWPERYSQLAVMVDAGLSLEHALATINKGLKNADPQLDRALGLVKRGKSFSTAFKTSGILSNFDYALLRTAETAGRLGEGLKHISELRINHIQRVRSLKTGLMLPKMVLLIGGLAGIFVKMNTGGQSVLQAVLSVSLTLVFVFAISYVFERLLLCDIRHYLSLLWPINYFRKTNKRYHHLFEAVFFRALNWQLNSGIDARKALHNCQALLTSKPFKTQVADAAKAVEQGHSIPETLEMHNLVLSQRMRQVLLIAQQSGRYQQAIEHELTLQGGNIKQDVEALIKWAPRFYYLIVILVISRFIMTP